MAFPDQLIPLAYNEVVSVPPSTPTLVVETGMGRLHVELIICSGTIYAEFIVKLNNNKLATKRSSPSRNATFHFPTPLFVEEGSRVKVEVTHYRTDVSPKFEVGIFTRNYF